jgi:hypothetical protein
MCVRARGDRALSFRQTNYKVDGYYQLIKIPFFFGPKYIKIRKKMPFSSDDRPFFYFHQQEKAEKCCCRHVEMDKFPTSLHYVYSEIFNIIRTVARVEEE